MKLFKFKKIKYKTISYCLILTLIISIFSNVLVGATSNININKVSGFTSLFENFISPLKKETKTTNSLTELSDNILPNIKVDLTSEKEVKYSGSEIEVTYELIPEKFNYTQNNNTEDKEVVFIIDTSSDMEALDKVKSALINRMINSFLNNGSKIKFNIITYNSQINTYIVDSQAKDNNGVLIDYRNELQKVINNITKGNSNDKKLGEAIKKADEFFDKNGNSNSLKNIIIIAAGDPTDDIPNIDKDKYNVITLALNKIDNYNNPEENYKNNYEKLKEWHKLLGGDDNNYFISAKRGGNNDIDSGTEIANKNPLAPNGDIMSVMAQKIKDSNYNSYIINDVKLSFDLSSNFDLISGLQQENESNYSITVPKIIYMPVEKVSDNKYRYEANTIQISFKIRPKYGKFGNLEFGKNSSNKLSNYISYISLENKMVKEGIQTPGVIVKESDESEVDSEENIDIRILEIEPADSFKITNKSNNSHIRTGVEETTVSIDDKKYNVQIDHISMPEFVGKVDKINGKYDVIVIGRFNDYINITDTKNVDQLQYRDYNNTQYYCNDITERKANEIIDFAKTGQLIYIDKNINSLNLNNMNMLKTLFGDSSDNCNTNLSIEEITLNNIVKEYIELDKEYKSIKFTTTKPTGDSVDAEKGDPNKRNLKFDINMSTKDLQEDSFESVDINLYLDIDGDGIFKQNEYNNQGDIISKGEVVSSLEDVKVSDETISIEYQMPSDFVGYLEWKIEIVKENNIKSYISNEKSDEKILFKSLTGEKLPIKVLQVAPYDDLSDKIMGNLNLGPVEKGGNLRFNLLLEQVKDYDINIEVISMDEFNERAGNDNNPLILNGVYDMIIFGFADTFNGKDINDNAANALREFINTGQSVMFTHDTFFYWNSPNRVDKLLDVVGQIKNKETPLDYKNTQSKTVYETNNSLITNYPFDLEESLNVRRTHKQWYQLDLESENLVPWFTITPNTVTQNSSNKDYDGEVPEDILAELEKNGLVKEEMEADDLNKEYSYWSIMTQGLEDYNKRVWLWKEDTSPDEGGVNKVNQYDVKNFYYTYSIGNIVFSGTAENTKEKFTPYPTEELKLFVNTIAKAIRGANHAPTITEVNIYDNMEIDKEQDSFSFSSIFTDLDNDDIRSEIYIDNVLVNDVIKKINDKNVDNSTNLNAYYKSGTTIDYLIPKKYYDGKDSINIKIKAVDNGGKNGSDGAQSEKKFTIKVTSLPILATAQGHNYLVGEELSTFIKINKLNVSNKNIKSIKILLSAPDNNLLELSSKSPTQLIYDVPLNSFNNDEVNIEYKFKANSPIQGYKVTGIIKYTYSDKGSAEITKEIPIEIPINIKEGEISVKVVNLSSSISLPDNLTISNGNTTKLLSTGNMVKFTSVITGEYNISINGLTNQYMAEFVGDNSINISYDNFNVECIINIHNSNTNTIMHGIYEGLGNDEIKIYEYTGEVGNEYAKNSIVQFAASFEINKNSSTDIILTPDGGNDSIQGLPIIYKLDISSGKAKLIRLDEMKKQIDNSNNFVYNIKNETNDSMKIVVLYNYKLLGTKIWYTNNIRVYNSIEKDAKVKVGEDKNKYGDLPDLF